MGAGPSQPPGLDAPLWAVALQPVAALVRTAGDTAGPLLRSWFTPCPNPLGLGGHGGHWQWGTLGRVQPWRPLVEPLAVAAVFAPLGYITWCGWKHGRLSYLLPAGSVACLVYWERANLVYPIPYTSAARSTIFEVGSAVRLVGGLAIPHLLTCCHGCRATGNVPRSWWHDDDIPSWVSRPFSFDQNRAVVTRALGHRSSAAPCFPARPASLVS